jgi:ComF family protein
MPVTSPFYSALLDRWPSQCAVCKSWPSRPVCGNCMARLARPCARCPTCALALPASLSRRNGPEARLCGACTVHPPPLTAAFVAFDYAYPWSELLTQYKFGGRTGWARFFAGALADLPALRQHLGALESADVLLPMPLSPERLRQRGFNQAWELARMLGRLCGSPARCEARLLLRTRHTRPQTELSRAERLANVRGAFQVDPLRAALLQGRKVVLVDDVVTSGASLFTAAQALRDAGAREVTGVAIARTDAPH